MTHQLALSPPKDSTAVEHVLGMLAASDTAETILDDYPSLQADDIRACLIYAHRLVSGEQVQERLSVQQGR